MSEELEQLLKNLKLRRMLSVYDEQLRAAEKAQISYSEFMAGLLRAQWHERQESALEWRIRRANLPERWSLETFPWSSPACRQPKTDAHLCRTGFHCQTRESGAGGKDRSG
jgi:DNA replication protein DnaC